MQLRNRDRCKRSSGKSQGRRRDQRGIALITTLLLVMLLTGITLAMVFSARSDLLINGWYRNYRGAFYAADSGLNIARQDMLNQLVAAIPNTFAAGTQPIAPGTDATIQTNIQNNYGKSYQPVLGNGASSNSWPEKYEISNVSLNLSTCQVQGTTGTCAAPAAQPTGYQYIYNYSLTSVGQSSGTEAATLTDTGTLTVTAVLVPASSNKSFAAWGMFIDNSPVCPSDGSTLVNGMVSGPVFTNGAWNFNTGKYVFTDPVQQAAPKAGFNFGAGGCSQVAGASATQGQTTIAPNFNAGFKVGQPQIPLPVDSYNQERAVLDGKGIDPTKQNQAGSQPTQAELNAGLRDVKQQKYPASGAVASGVFMPYDFNSSGVPLMKGGGIYVEGSANITLTPLAGSSTAQVYTILNGGTTTTITVDPGVVNPYDPSGALGYPKGSTTMVSGGKTQVIGGVPTQFDPTSSAPIGPATLLFVDGDITGLTGPGEGKAAIQDGTQLTIVAQNTSASAAPGAAGAGNIAITGDIKYKNEPVTLAADPNTGVQADQLIPGNDKGQVLGIFSAKGDIQLHDTQLNSQGKFDGNLEIDASMATLSTSGTGGLTNTGNALTNLTIVGGRIQNNIKNINTTTRNVLFDKRFAQGMAPPWFPSTKVTLGGIDTADVTKSFQRIQWLTKSSF